MSKIKKIVNPNDFLYLNATEKFYVADKYDEEIKYDDFIKNLKESVPTNVICEEVKLKYSDDKTKLTLVHSKYTKKFIKLKDRDLKKLVPSKDKEYNGITFDLKHHNFYLFYFDKKTGRKKIKCNEFNTGFINLPTLVDKLIITTNLGAILSDKLGLGGEDIYTLQEAIGAFYMKHRNIEYYNLRYIPIFLSILKPLLHKKYKNINIFDITKEILNIKNIENVKLFYKTMNTKKPMYFFYYLKLYDSLNITESVDEYLSSDYIDLNDYRHVINLKTLFEFSKYLDILTPYYNFNISDFNNKKMLNVLPWLETLYVFYKFNKKLNFEYQRTYKISKVKQTINVLIKLLFEATYNSGAIITNPECVSEIQKIFGDGYRIESVFNPKILKDYLELISTNESELIFFNVYKGDDCKTLTLNLKENKFDLSDSFDLGKKIKISLDKFKKFHLFLKKSNSEYLNNIENFSVKYSFSEEVFVDLCKSEKINYKKYLKDI